MDNVVIVSGVRTPIGAYGGSLRDIHVAELAAHVLREAVTRCGVEPGWVDDVIMGQSYQNGECANGARLALLEAGWPDWVPGVTLDRRCCSGLDAVFFGVMKIQTGNADIVVAGGMESMSQAELYLPGRHQMGSGGKSRQEVGLDAEGSWSPFPLGSSLFRQNTARPGHVSAYRALWGTQLHDDLGRDGGQEGGHLASASG